MYALTVKQPFARAIADFGKTVVNRARRPPDHLIGQRIAIHVGQATDAWHAMRRPHDVTYKRHEDDLLKWVHGQRSGIGIPDTGRIIATARLVGYVDSTLFGTEIGGLPYEKYIAAMQSPWHKWPSSWVLEDVRKLRKSVGSHPPSVLSSICGRSQPFVLTDDVEAAVFRAECETDEAFVMTQAIE